MERTAEIAHARDCDTKISAAWSAYFDLASEAHGYIKEANRYAKRSRAPYIADLVAGLHARAEALQSEIENRRVRAQELNDSLYTGWSRFFLVQHIHSNQYCSSFRPTTRVGWLPEVSGLTEAEAVAEYGAILCTICFPSAPVEWTQGKQDDSCPGSGKSIDWSLEHRVGFYSGNWATCSVCEKGVGIRSGAYNVPKHK